MPPAATCALRLRGRRERWPRRVSPRGSAATQRPSRAARHRRPSRRRRWLRAWCRAPTRESSGFVPPLDDLLAAVVAARTDVVAPMYFSAHRFDGERRIGEEIVRAVHATLGCGFLVLLYSHGQ